MRQGLLFSGIFLWNAGTEELQREMGLAWELCGRWPKCGVCAPRSYLLIDFHGLFGVVEKELFTGRSQVNVYLEAGVLREFPAVRTTAEGAIKCFCDGRIHQGALRLLGPHATEKGEREQTQAWLLRTRKVSSEGIVCRLPNLKNLFQIYHTIYLLKFMPLNRVALGQLQYKRE